MYRLARRQHGFTLVELIIIVTIIGIIFAILVPYFLDSLQKAKQRRTMANIGNVGKAMMSWMTDQVSAAAAGAGSRQVDLSGFPGPFTGADMQSLLVPVYVAHVPEKDAWGNPFEYYMNTTTFESGEVIAIRSTGNDGVFSGTTYTVGPFFSTQYSEDLVWADGFFVRWPQNWKD